MFPWWKRGFDKSETGSQLSELSADQRNGDDQGLCCDVKTFETRKTFFSVVHSSRNGKGTISVGDVFPHWEDCPARSRRSHDVGNRLISAARIERTIISELRRIQVISPWIAFRARPKRAPSLRKVRGDVPTSPVLLSYVLGMNNPEAAHHLNSSSTCQHPDELRRV